MNDVATTTLSSRGQVVIPEAIRSRLGLEAGTRFVVIAEGDTVIFKALEPPPVEALGKLLDRARTAATEAGLTRDAVDRAIARVRQAG